MAENALQSKGFKPGKYRSYDGNTANSLFNSIYMGEILPSQDGNPFFRICLKTEIHFYRKIWTICFLRSNIATERADLLQQTRESMNTLFCESSGQERHRNDLKIAINHFQSWGFTSLNPPLGWGEGQGGGLPLNPAAAAGPWPGFSFF